jgi:hypothetical protein
MVDYRPLRKIKERLNERRRKFMAKVQYQFSRMSDLRLVTVS